ncbi:MAG: hypothetical protein IJN25_02445 [Clostridia bacterium]|nr:hypothetical protein [Oscillospiraceae bacterium]MBQ7032509.1 hypothetical protein [Clostridia bacterium]
MTPKELMYMEDALGMEQQLETKCNDYASKVQDPNLQNTLRQFATQHQQHYSCLLKQLNQ